jgi:cytochrome c oxidase subunit III
MSAASVVAAAEPAPSARARRETAAFGMWVFIASEAMFFGGLLVCYAYARLRFPQGFAAAGHATDIVLGTVNTAALLTSSFLVALAATAALHRKRVWIAPLLGAAALLGVVFLVLKGIEYRHDWHEGLFPGPGFHLGAASGAAVPPGAELFFMLYFTMTGVHALHLTIGVAWLLVLTVGTRRTGPAPALHAAPSKVEVAGLYWHFVDVVWIFLYPLLYLMGRNG